MQCVRIEKLEQVSDTHTLHVGYWVKGVLLAEIEVGKPVFVMRFIRNDVKVPGVMNTSIVTKIVPKGEGVLHLDTQNSIYRVEFIDGSEFAEEIEATKQLLGA